MSDDQKVIQRLAEAYCTLNRRKWDYYFGPIPEVFKSNSPASQKAQHEYAIFLMNWIKERVPEDMLNRTWWQSEGLGTEEDWKEWYYNGEDARMSATIIVEESKRRKRTHRIINAIVCGIVVTISLIVAMSMLLT